MDKPLLGGPRSPRSGVGAVLAVFFLLLALIAPTGLIAKVAAQDGGDEEKLVLAEVPTTGAARSGPIAASPVAEETEEDDEEASEGVAPVAIQIGKIAVDAAIERVNVVDGVMQNPTGPWIVSWYEDLAAPGQGGNTVMAGHVDYWNVGPAVFYGLKEPGLVEGDTIRVIGQGNVVFEYAVEWSRLYDVATELTPEVIQQDIVGETDEESLTLITCGGEFNAATGEYVSRMVVRATKI